MNRIIAVFIVAFMLIGVLSGCKNSGSGNSQNEDNVTGKPDYIGPDSGKTPDDGDVIIGDGEHKPGGEIEGQPDGEWDVNEESPELNVDDNVNDDNLGADDDENEKKENLTVGYQVGNLAPAKTIEAASGGTVNISDYKGKVVVINLWGEWCYWCKVELPDFNRVANEYDDVVVLAMHSNYGRSAAPEYINTNFADSKIVFAYDNAQEAYYYALGGTGSFPRTLVLDKNGVITYAKAGAIDYATLSSLVESAGATK